MFARCAAAWVVCAGILFASGAAYAQTQSVILQIGSQVPSLSALPFYVADKAGFFADDKLSVEIRYTANAPTATQIVATGNADIGMMTNEPIIMGYAKGVHAKMFFVHQRPLNYYVGIPEASPIHTIADLKGKNIGVSNLGSAAVPVLRSMMRTVGAEAGRDYTLVPVGVLDQALAALRTNRVAAVAMWESQFAAFHRIGFPMRYLRHPTLADFGNTGLFASEQTIKNKPEALCGMGRATLKAMIFIRENPTAALHIYWEVNPAARAGKDEASVLASGMREIEYMIKGYRPYKDGQKDFGLVDHKGFERYMQMFKDEGLLKEVPPINDLVTDQFIACSNKIDAAAVRQKARNWKK
jgi:NitT/TauT family transport system substrate-binding protein